MFMLNQVPGTRTAQIQTKEQPKCNIPLKSTEPVKVLSAVITMASNHFYAKYPQFTLKKCFL